VHPTLEECVVGPGDLWLEARGTEELAEMVAGLLRMEGLSVDLRPPRHVKGLQGYDAVIVGGALDAFRWHRAARRFVQRHSGELRTRPMYFFSSGPLDDSAGKRDIPPGRGVKVAGLA